MTGLRRLRGEFKGKRRRRNPVAPGLLRTRWSKTPARVVRLGSGAGIHAVAVRVLALLVLLLVPAVVSADETTLPAGERPVPVAAGFYLLNLNGVEERDETFDAAVYLSLRWRDPLQAA